MTRLLTTGYETGDVNEAGVTTTGSGASLSVVNTVPVPRAGAYCLKVLGSATAWNPTYKSFAFVPKTEIWVRFAMYAHVVATIESWIATVLDSAGVAQNTLTYSSNDGLLRIRLGNAFGGTLLATASTAFSQDAWHLVDWRTQILSTTTGTTEVWLDGNRIINFSGS